MRAVPTFAAAALLFVTVVAIPTSGSATRPPSSVEPAPNHKRVMVSHRHQRVAACALVRSSEAVSCSPRLEEANSATSVTFTPAGRLLSTVSAQRPLTVTFPSRVGAQELNAELAVGAWTAAWSGAPNVTRVDVPARGTVALSLRTVSGRCERTRSGCKLVETVSRRATVLRTE